MADYDEPVWLQSNDGERFRVTLRVARLSEVVEKRLEDFGLTCWRGIRRDECALCVEQDGVVTHVQLKSDPDSAPVRPVRRLGSNEMVEKDTRHVRIATGGSDRALDDAARAEWLAIEEADDVIELAEVAAKELRPIVRWMVHHAENPTPAASEEDEARTDNIVEFDREMLDALSLLTDEDQDLLAAANYMHVQELIDTICKWQADIVKGKTPSEIYAMRGLRPEDMAEDEKAVREEETWIERYYTGEPEPAAAAKPEAVEMDVD